MENGGDQEMWPPPPPPCTHPPCPGPSSPPTLFSRGDAWLFFPSAFGTDAESGASLPPCHCSCDGSYCNEGFCRGSGSSTQQQLNATLRHQIISGRRWIVFIHGGDFTDYTPVTGFYAQLASRVAAASGMGVLSIDYRTVPTFTFPAPVEDTIQALEWLELHGASELYIYGDSSGGTQAMEVLLQLSALQLQGKPTVNVR